jgi:hypothetical protein
MATDGDVGVFAAAGVDDILDNLTSAQRRARCLTLNSVFCEHAVAIDVDVANCRERTDGR